MVFWRNIIADMSDLIFPGSQPCYFCGLEITGQGKGGVCPACKERIFALPEELGQCAICGMFTRRDICPNCLDWDDAALQGVVSVAPYQGFYRELIQSLKNQGRKETAKLLGRLMAEKVAGSEIKFRVQMIIPVPLHPYREMERGFNQSRWLAREVAALLGIPLYDNLLVRVRHETSQSVLGRRDRRQNIAGIFQCEDHRAIKGKGILLVDDIITTGSTLRSCAAALRESGTDAVYGLTWAAGVEKK